MSFTRWLQNVLSASAPGRGTRASRPRRRSLQLALEQLEDRTVPASFTAATVPDLIADMSAAILVAPAADSQPVAASGTLLAAGPPTITSVRVAGGNTILTRVDPILVTGDLTGTAILESRFVIHPDGSFTFRTVESFTGTFAGQSGTLVFLNVGRGAGTSFEGHTIILSGTAGLANLRGGGTFAGDIATGAATYSVRLHFDP